MGEKYRKMLCLLSLEILCMWVCCFSWRGRGSFILSTILSQTKREENPGAPVNDFISAKAS